MKKRSKDISLEFEKMAQDKCEENLLKIQNKILEECRQKNEDLNKLFFEEKMKHYKLFKSSKTTSKNNEWKSILNLRTHSKKVKKRGRKSKKSKSMENENENILQEVFSQLSPGTNESVINENEDKVIYNFDYVQTHVFLF